MITGETNKEIAALIGSSAFTVNFHIQHIIAKLGGRTRTGAAVIFARWIDTQDRIAFAQHHSKPAPLKAFARSVGA